MKLWIKNNYWESIKNFLFESFSQKNKNQSNTSIQSDSKVKKRTEISFQKAIGDQML